jgi:hypothetical protein
MLAPYDGYVADGHTYNKDEEVWDLGDWSCAKIESDGIRHYTGNGADQSNLPPYAPDGSDAIDYATSTAYGCHKGAWIEI